MSTHDQPDTPLVKIPLGEVCRDCFEDETDEQLGCGNGASWHYRPGGDGWGPERPPIADFLGGTL